MYSCNKIPGSLAKFLKMVVEDDNTLTVTATGQRHDSHSKYSVFLTFQQDERVQI